MGMGRVIGGRVTGGRVTVVVVVVGGTVVVVVVVVVGGTVVVVGGTVVVVVGGGGGVVVGGGVGLVVGGAEGAEGEETVTTGGPAGPPAEVGAVGWKLKGSVRKDGKLDTTALFLAAVCGVPTGKRKGAAGLGTGRAVGAGKDPDPEGKDVAVGVGTVARVSNEFWVDGWRLKRIAPMPTAITTPAMMMDQRQNVSSSLESAANELPLFSALRPRPTTTVDFATFAATHRPDMAVRPIGIPWRLTGVTKWAIRALARRRAHARPCPVDCPDTGPAASLSAGDHRDFPDGGTYGRPGPEPSLPVSPLWH
jgi:hypothetical protein